MLAEPLLWVLRQFILNRPGRYRNKEIDESEVEYLAEVMFIKGHPLDEGGRVPFAQEIICLGVDGRIWQ
jgi:hypothetical protein